MIDNLIPDESRISVIKITLVSSQPADSSKVISLG